MSQLQLFAPIVLLGTFLLGCSDDPESPSTDSRSQPGPRSSVILVTIDTLRADRLGCYGYEKAHTPNLDALAKDGLRATSCVATVPLTLPAHTSLMTGTIPPRHGVRDNGSFQAVDELITLAELLQEGGWKTGGFVGAFVLDRMFGLDQGFEAYEGVKPEQVSLSGSIQERPATEVNTDAISWLAALPDDEPYFLWAHYFEPHKPYIRPAWVDPAMDPYDADIAAADRALGELLSFARDRSDWDNTYVVVTSDHGESLFEHGEETHGYFVYQEALEVPLIFVGPNLEPASTLDLPCSQVDIFPTLLELLHLEERGLNLPSLPLPARSLVSKAEAPKSRRYFESFMPLYSHGWSPLQGIAEGAFKYIRAPQAELYDLDQDPDEKQNLLADRDSKTQYLSNRLDDLLDLNTPPDDYSDPRRMMSDADREALIQLGYINDNPELEVEATSRIDPKAGVTKIRERNRAYKLFEQGRFADALEIILTLLEEEPENALFHSHAGALMVSVGKPQEALPHLEKTLQFGLYTAGNLYNLARCQQTLGKMDAAIESLKRGLKLNPMHMNSYLLIGELYGNRGDKELARDSYQSFLDRWAGSQELAQDVRQRLLRLE